MKRISLCADDYAITPGVSQAIRCLADKGAIQATSCMVTMPDWQREAVPLQAYFDQIDIGLHLNFTEGAGLTHAFKAGYPGLYKMLIMSHLRGLKYQQLLDEISAQLDSFIETTGRNPDFIDGHQHVHHLPHVRQALLEVMHSKRLPPSTWVRSVSPLVSPVRNLKSRIIEGSGAVAFRLALTQAEYRTNHAFAGVYSLSTDEAFRPLMQSWLSALPDGGLIMCHPGLTRKVDDAESQALDHAEARLIEFNYLASEHFSSDCENAGVQLCKPSGTSV